MNTAGIAYDAHGHEIVIGSRTEDRNNPVPAFKDVLQTYTGKVLKPLESSPGDFDIRDIAWSLAMQCRYNGHTNLFYSVATHCILVSWHCPVGLKRDGLLHDASEAYLSDLPSPMKARMPEYRKLELQVEEAIAQEFNLTWPMAPAVKAADDKVFQLECSLVMGGEIERRYALPHSEERDSVESFIIMCEKEGPRFVANLYLDTYQRYHRRGV